MAILSFQPDPPTLKNKNLRRKNIIFEKSCLGSKDGFDDGLGLSWASGAHLLAPLGLPLGASGHFLDAFWVQFGHNKISL